MTGNLKKINQRRLIEGVGLLALFLTLLSLAITLTINARFLYVWDIDYLNILAEVPLSKAELLTNYDQLMNYLNVPWHTVLTMDDFPVSASGASHFYDVKVLFQINYGIFLLSLIPSFLYLRYLKERQQLFRLISPFKFALMIPIMIGFLMVASFQRFFVFFHEVFFMNDNWLFDIETDPIIGVLPADYFFHNFILFFILLELLFGIMVFVGRYSLKRGSN